MDNYEQAVQTLRFLAIDAVEKADSGHPGTPMALSTAAVELFSEHLRYVPEVPDWPNRDRFVLSCGHASMPGRWRRAKISATRTRRKNTMPRLAATKIAAHSFSGPVA